GDRDRHPAVLEGAGRVDAVVLEVDLAAGQLGEHLGDDQRGPTLAEGHDRRRVGDRHAVAVLVEEAPPHVGATRRRCTAHDHTSDSTRSTLVTLRTQAEASSAWTHSRRSPSRALWVISTSCAVSPDPSCQTWAIDTSWSPK